MLRLPFTDANKTVNRVIVIITIILVYAFFYYVGIGCPIRFLTGVSCAGCGMTRAYIQAAHLDFRSAMHFHPLFWIPPVYILYCAFIKRHLKTRHDNMVSFLLISLFLLVYICRLTIVRSDILAFNPSNGAIWKINKIIIDKGKYVLSLLPN